MEKLVVVINGVGAVGKDTLCDFVSNKYDVKNISSITPVKEIAKKGGWAGEKDHLSRLLLSELKRLFTSYNDLCYRYLLKEYEAFKYDNNSILFLHIREPNEIERIVKALGKGVVTLLIRNSLKDEEHFGNTSDDSVENYSYDYYYDNCLPLEKAEDDFISVINRIFLQDAIQCNK